MVAESRRAASGGKKGRSTGDAYGDIPIAEVLVASFETSVRTAFRMARLPVVCYVSMLDSWSRTVESALKEFEPADRGK